MNNTSSMNEATNGSPSDTAFYKIDKNSVLWNLIGSLVAAASSFVLLLFVTRILGIADGGTFSLAFSTAQILLTVGKFGIRSFQATDLKQEIPFSTYLQTRIWLCCSMLLLCLCYVIFRKYSLERSCIFLAVCFIKMSDAVEDVFHGELQSHNKLDVAGKLLTVRNLFTMLLFGTTLFLFGNLLSSCITTAVLSFLCTLLLNIIVTRKYIPVSLSFDKDKSLKILLACLPLFVGSFLSLYIYNAPKYAIDLFGSQEQIAVYSIIFMPAFVINLFSEFIFKPLLTQIAHLWNTQNYFAFQKLMKRFVGYIFLITILVISISWFIGVPILSFVYGVDISSYRWELTILLTAGGFSAAVYLFYNMLTSMRKQKIIMINYLIAACSITALTYFMTARWNITGAAYSYLITEIVLMMGMMGSIRYYLKCSEC